MTTASGARLGGDDSERDQRLRQAIQRARRSEFYRHHLEGYEVSDVEDLVRLPLTRKDDIRDASPFGMLAVPASAAWHYHESSGTTGEPISTWWDLREVRLLADMLCRTVPELAGAILLNRLPGFAPGSFIFEEALRASGACHIPAGNMTWDVPFPRALGFIRRLGVTALACLPFEALLLRELALAQGIDFGREATSVNVIFCGGSVLPPSLRRVIENDWQARVVEVYGSNEAMGLGLSCERGRLHLCTDLVEAEVLDPRSCEPVPAGKAGVLTVTSLVHEVMPLVRYFTEDLVRLDAEACSCGDPRPTATVLGRLEEVVELQGRAVSPYELLDAAHDVAARLGTRIFYVVVRHCGLHFRIEVDGAARLSPTEVEAELRRRLGVPVTIEFLAINEVLDRGALLRSPKIYKPSLVADWRRQPRKTLTIMEGILEWPKFDGRTLLALAGRQMRNAVRRRRLLREDRR